MKDFKRNIEIYLSTLLILKDDCDYLLADLMQDQLLIFLFFEKNLSNSQQLISKLHFLFNAFSARHLPMSGANLNDWPEPPEKTVIFDLGLSRIKFTSFVIV